MTKYSDQKNLLILLSLLKQYNIRRIIVSPGATVTNFAGSVQEDDFFELYSSVDERSACYMACGMAAEAKEPVAIVCTGATASRNYLPGLTEAYYRKLPVLAITSAMFHGNIGHNIPQMIDRTRQLNDIARKSVQIHEVRDKNDEWLVTVDINKALHALTENGGGPVHINLEISNAPHFSISELPVARKINKYHLNSTNLPELKGKKVAVAEGLKKGGYIEAVEVEDAKPRGILHIVINNAGEIAKINEISKVSKPGRRVYAAADEIPKVKSGRGIVLVSTSKGIMTGEEARKNRLGGEILVKVY